MRRLFPVGDETEPVEGRWALERLARAYAYPHHQGGASWLRANMVSSLDGAAHHQGRSQPLSSPADMRIFGVLRALADVIVVGAETVRREQYGPARARAEFAAARAAADQHPAPAIAVVTASLGLDFELPLFTDAVVPTVLLTGEAAPPAGVAAARAAGVEVLRAGAGVAVEPERIKPALAALGYTRLLTEGGPRLLGQLAASGQLDELCLALSPRLASGGAERIAHGPEMAVPRELRLGSVLEDEGFLFMRYARE